MSKKLIEYCKLYMSEWHTVKGFVHDMTLLGIETKYKHLTTYDTMKTDRHKEKKEKERGGGGAAAAEVCSSPSRRRSSQSSIVVSHTANSASVDSSLPTFLLLPRQARKNLSPRHIQRDQREKGISRPIAPRFGPPWDDQGGSWSTPKSIFDPRF